MPMPNSYDPDLFDEIIEKIRDQGWIKVILEEGRAQGLPYPTYQTWRTNWMLREGNGEKFDDARSDYANKLGFEIIAKADNRVDHPAHNSNSIKARMWVAERLNRKQWGAQQTITHEGNLQKLTPEQLQEQIDALLREAEDGSGSDGQ